MYFIYYTYMEGAGKTRAINSNLPLLLFTKSSCDISKGSFNKILGST